MRSARRLGMGLLAAIGLALSWPAGCSTDPESAVTACLKGTEPLYARYEGAEPDTCRSDADCSMSGCSSEVCAAQPAVTTCEAIPTPRANYGCSACACLDGRCRWVRTND